MYLMIAFILGFIAIFFIYKRQVQPNITTLAGAPIMATGVVIISVFKNVIKYDVIELTLFIFFILSVLLLVFYIISDTKKGLLYERHLKDPVASFGLGTWIAAISIGNVLISIYQPNIITVILYLLNIGILWVFYIAWTFRNYYVIFHRSNEYKKRLQGGLLLSTVATQSVAISGFFVFGDQFPVLLSRVIIWFGLLLYLVNFLLIMYRYLKLRSAEIIDHWTNSNCIIHGALSITGVALSFAYPDAFWLHYFVWGLTLLLFVIVECIEITRGFFRYRSFGWNEGFLVYSPSQWSRIFTFGMFLFFTERTFVIGQDAVQAWVSWFLNGMSTTILLLFVIQWLILVKSLFNELEDHKAM